VKIVRVIARLNVGGPAKHVVWLTKGLQSDECKSLLVAGTVPQGEDDMGYFASEMGVSPLFIPEMSREISARDAITIWKLYKLFLRECPDIIHTHTAKAGTVGRIAGFLYRWVTPGTLVGRPRRCRVVHTYHGHIFHGYYGPLKTRLFLAIEKTLAKLMTDRIVVISEQQRKEINEQFRVGTSQSFVVIPLGLDLSIFSNWNERGQDFRKEIGAAESDVVVGIVGRLTEIKNHDLFLSAAAIWKKQKARRGGARVRFVIVGDGSLRNRLESQARSQGLGDDVIFVGSRRDVENIYPALDIVALTSKNEGTPLTLIEAMANARPVISTAAGGVVDLLGEPLDDPNNELPFKVCERGVSVPPNDANAFAAGLDYLVADAKLRRRLGMSGLQFVASNYSRERLVKDISALYANLIDDHSVAVKTHAAENRIQSGV
jgi:glycosyltransferase involved in cell wall biosynthesis